MGQCGIGSIINKSNGKIYLFKSKDLTKSWENYHALLNANYHHNRNLQEDWNEYDSSNFIFEIKEIEDDEEILNKKFNKYLENSNNIYLDVKLDNIPFNYKTKILLKELYFIIGETQINPIFKNKLSSYNIEESYYSQIKECAEKSIKNGEIRIGGVEELLDELISEIIETRTDDLINKKENLLDGLYELTGKNELSEDYLRLLDKNRLSEEIGLEIKSELEDLINGNKLEGSVINKFNQLINEKLLLQLYEITGEIDLSDNYVKILQNKEISPEIGFEVRNNLKKDIIDGKIRNVLISDVLDDALEVGKINNLRKELKNDLSILFKDIPSSFININLKKYELSQRYALKTKNKIIRIIDSDKVYNKKCKLKFEELSYYKEHSFKNEIIKCLEEYKKLIDIKLNQLYEITGKDTLNDSFKTLLINKGLNEQAGWNLVSQLKEDIINEKISEDFEINLNNRLNQMEIDKNRSFVLLENKIGSYANNYSFSELLSKHCLYPNSHGISIKMNMEKLIQSGEVNPKIFDNVLTKELDREVDEKNNRLKNDVDKVIGLNEIKQSFLTTIKASNLTENDAVDIRSKVLNSINNNEIQEKGAITEINRLIASTGKIRTKELLIKKVDDIIGDKTINLEFSQKLDSYDLDNSYAQKIKYRVINQIENGVVSLDNLESFIESNLKFYDKNNVKTYLEKLSQNQIDYLVNKYHIIKSPMNNVNINNLISNVPLTSLKIDLAEFGNYKYNVKYGSRVTNSTFDDGNHNFCSECGAKLDGGSNFCGACGKRVG